MIKKSMILILLLFVVGFTPKNKYSKINQVIKFYSESKLLVNSTWALYAKYADNNEVIISLNPNMSVAPASGLKVFTSSLALDVLGSDYKFETKLFYDGEISNGILNGNIYIVGGGDPTLGSSLVKGSLSMDELFTKWKNKITEKGITKINGNIIADDLMFDEKSLPDQWNWIDIGNYYGASSPALTINDNLYYLFFETGAKEGDSTRLIRTEPELPDVTFENHILTGKKFSGDNGYVYLAPNSKNAILSGTLPAGEKEFSIKGSLPDPTLFAAQAFNKFLLRNNVEVNGKSLKVKSKIKYDSNKLIDLHKSPELKDIVYIVNKRSNNLYTELLLKMVAYKKTGLGSTDNGIEILEDFLTDNKINTDALILYDGCGLSREDAISAKMMVDLLSMNMNKKYFSDFYNSLGIVGDPDDISFYKSLGVGTPLEKNARMKSGSIVGVRSYSGYLKDKSGRTIVFSMIANNYKGSGSEVNKIHLELMKELANLKSK
jgi:D-alanyl-D-alanine carboxypeptidase/D-alanyl-D-alanine-endopeptidase (penicillin-binding protein 4)